MKPAFRGAIALLAASVFAVAALPADHNDPNAVNSIYDDVPVSGADLYDIFGYPSDDTTNGEAVVVQLTFAPVPRTGVFDRDLMYKIHLQPTRRISDFEDAWELDNLIRYFDGIKDRFFNFETPVIKVTFNDQNQARADFIGFPGGDFHRIVATNEVVVLDTPNDHKVKAFLGGRDDAFFNTLHGFFRSINYAPQFYRVPVEDFESLAELPIPKTLLELEENKLFNFDPDHPLHGKGEKYDLPQGPYEWTGRTYKKDANGNFRFVYDGEDAQAGRNVNTLSFEIPLAFMTETPQTDRIVRMWGGSYVLKASSRVPAYAPGMFKRILLSIQSLFTGDSDMEFITRDAAYVQVDHDGSPFTDAALNLRYDSRVGPNNIPYLRDYTLRFAHLGWGFGPSVSALGLPTCFDHDNAPVPVHRTYKLAVEAFPRVKNCFFQTLNMPDDSWNKSGKDIPLKRTFEIFVPNLTSIDMDTTGTWPYGRRPEDQVATRFLALFLDMTKKCGNALCNIETLNDPALWQNAPVEPKTVPNPRFNDKPFLKEFPYLAAPWPEEGDSYK